MRGEESGRVGITDCEAGVRTGFAITRFLQEVRCKAGRVVRDADPYNAIHR